ncbi:hypothetical protein GU243_08295 [Pseudarthrobacter psychrotolerans]|uniref:Uncharacterized protein n=1 Tax=Pseudarthrobacter psychrotolerans TaxID=2697569 RepID=A0A6P1NLP0_9MICC|nr:hypothetical protein [Pseudarthrobacter psychrotolerans]QHK19727.1 hypothetical protein GU243_08295 [Pseudarthrobacter psychrotolerans]
MAEPEQLTIRNSVPNILANEAYGPDWKRTRDGMVVNMASGTSTHLFLKSGSGGTTLCGEQSARVSRGWFRLSGCKKCSKAAIKQDVATITDTDTDTDGTIIDVATTPKSRRRHDIRSSSASGLMRC